MVGFASQPNGSPFRGSFKLGPKKAWILQKNSGNHLILLDLDSVANTF